MLLEDIFFGFRSPFCLSKSTLWAEFGHIKWYYKFKGSSCLSRMCMSTGQGMVEMNMEANREVYAKGYSRLELP